MRKSLMITGFVVATILFGSLANAAHRWGLKEGTPDLKSAGQLAFGPDGVLFVGDAKGAAVFAIDTADAQEGNVGADRNVDNLNDRLTELLGKAAAVNDLAVNPLSGRIYLSVTIGESEPGLVRIDNSGKLSRLSLDKVPFLKAVLPNPPEDKVTGEGRRARNKRNEAITDLAYVEGKLLVAGLTNDSAPSAVREIPFPFANSETGTQIEIYHGAHGQLENSAAIRTFVPFNIDGQPSLLAGFTCTPLVRFPLDNLKSGSTVRGTTVAELGNMNMPLDMITYEKDGEKFLLMANSARGVMKISTRDIGRAQGITEPVKGGGTAGQTFEKIGDLQGTVQLDRLDASKAVIIVQHDGNLSLKTVPLP